MFVKQQRKSGSAVANRKSVLFWCSVLNARVVVQENARACLGNSTRNWRRKSQASLCDANQHRRPAGHHDCGLSLSACLVSLATRFRYYCGQGSSRRRCSKRHLTTPSFCRSVILTISSPFVSFSTRGFLPNMFLFNVGIRTFHTLHHIWV